MIAGTVRFLIDKEDPREADEVMHGIMCRAAAIGLNCLVSWSFAPAMIVEATSYQLEEQHADFIGDAIAASRRH